MKVLHLIYTDGVAGAERHIKCLLPGLSDEGIDCELMIICPHEAVDALKQFYSELAEKKIKITVIIAGKISSFLLLREINRYLRKNSISVVHSHLIRSDLLVSMVKQLFYKKLFIFSTKHGYNEDVQVDYISNTDFRIPKNLYYYATVFTLKNIDRNISVSKFISEMFVNLKLTKNLFHVIYHGVDRSEKQPDENNIFYKKGNPQLIIAGRLESLKGHIYAFEAMPEILASFPECKLVLIGDGSLKEHLTEKAKEIGISNHVEFLGFQKNPYFFFRESDLVIIPTMAEAFGLVFIEAMALKIPIVGFDVPAGNEIVHENTGCLVPKANSKKLAQQIIHLLNHPEKRKLLSENAYKDYSERYTTATMVRNTAKFYRSQKISRYDITGQNAVTDNAGNVPLKILHMIVTDGVSGAERHLHHLLTGMSGHGITCELFFISPSSAVKELTHFCKGFEESDVKTTIIVSDRPFSLQTAKQVNRYLRQNDISVLHSHLIRTDMLASLVKQFLFKKLFIISTKHGYQEKVLINYSPDKFKIPHNLHYYATKYTLKKIDKNISISNCISQLFLNFKLTKEYYPVIHHGVDVKLKKITDISFFRRATPQILILGRLEPYKGHLYVFKAMPLILKEYPNAQLILVGEGTYRDKLTDTARNSGILKNVQFLGFQKDPYSFIINSDVLVVPSLFEPFGLVFIEAMALKIPIIAFDEPAGNEILNNHTGRLVPKADSTELAGQILHLLNNPCERKVIAEAAYKDYLQKYTTAEMVKNTAEFYHSLNLHKRR